MVLIRHIILGALLLMLAACQPNIPSWNKPTEVISPFKIGVVLPLTIDRSGYGSSMQQTVALLVEKVNGCGGVLNQPVQVVMADSQKNITRAAITQLVTVDGVQGIVEAIDSKGTPIEAEVNIPILSIRLRDSVGQAQGLGFPAFREFYQQTYQRSPQVAEAQVWDAMALIILAAESAKATPGQPLQTNLKDVANAPGDGVADVCQALTLLREGRGIYYQGASEDLAHFL